MKMPTLRISDLNPHPKNEYFFDDIQGDGWNDLLQSVRTSGVTNAITVTEDGTIISGHQRVRACKLLGIEEIPAHVVRYTDEDLKKQKDVKDLIESNLKQRVPGNSNPVKLGRCFAFLESYYEIKHGNNQHNRTPNNSASKTQRELAEENGISADTMQNYKRLASSIPEMQELLNTGKVTPTTALAIMRQLSEEEQREFAQKVADEKKVSSRIADDYIASIKAEAREEARQESRATIEQLRRDNRTLANRAAGKTTIVAPEGYEDTLRQLESAQHTAQRAEEDFQRVRREYADLKKENDLLKEQIGTDKVWKEADKDIRQFTAATNNYIRMYGGHAWAFAEIENISDDARKEFLQAIRTLDGFAQQMIQNLGGVIDEE